MFQDLKQNPFRSPMSAGQRVISLVNDILTPRAYTPGRHYDFYGNNKALFDCREQEVMLSGPADTGKTLASLSFLNWIAWNYPGCELAVVRKTAASMPGTVLQSFQKKVLLPSDGISYYGGEKHPQRYIYPNGSVIWVGGLDKASKVLSSERDVIYVNQAEELIQPEWETLITRANGRAGNTPFAMVFGDCNPGPPTHWIRSRAKSGKLKFLEVSHRDNPDLYNPQTGEITAQGVGRIQALSNLTGATRLRLFNGIWAQPEGAIYEVFDEERHKIKDTPLPAGFPRFVGIDPYGSIIGALWFAFDVSNNSLIVYREYYQPFGLTTPQHVKNILELSGYDSSGHPMSGQAEPIYAWIGGGPSEQQARLDWDAAGIPLQKNEVVEIWSQIDKVIQLMQEGKLFIMESCSNLLNEIGSYSRKIVNGVVTNEIDHDENYHMLACLRYAVAWLTTPPEVQTVERFPYQRIGNY